MRIRRGDIARVRDTFRVNDRAMLLPAAVAGPNVLDNFNRSGPGLGANWDLLHDSDQVPSGIYDNAFKMIGAAGDGVNPPRQVMALHKNTPGADQFVEVEFRELIALHPQTLYSQWGLVLRGGTNVGSVGQFIGYIFMIGQAEIGGGADFNLRKYGSTGVSFENYQTSFGTGIGATVFDPAAVTAGTKFRFEVVGNVLTAKRNGVTIFSRTDNSITGTGTEEVRTGICGGPQRESVGTVLLDNYDAGAL